MPETMGSGGGFLDYNIDGLPDLFLVNGSEWPGHASGRPPATPRLYRNLGNGKFDDVTAKHRYPDGDEGAYRKYRSHDDDVPGVRTHLTYPSASVRPGLAARPVPTPYHADDGQINIICILSTRSGLA